MSWVGPPQPADLVDLLLNLQALEVVELGLVALERAVDVVLPTTRQVVLLPLPKGTHCYWVTGKAQGKDSTSC